MCALCVWLGKVGGQDDSGQVKAPARFQAEETKYKIMKEKEDYLGMEK